MLLQPFIHPFGELLWIFIIYSFLGWCLEVSLAAIKLKKFVNRGMLAGPYCPIYGFGMISIIILLSPLKFNVFLLFLGVVLLTSLLELLVGAVLEKIFHQKWWDYSDMKHNFRGYICLFMSILWGISCTIVVYCIQPIISIPIMFLQNNVGLILGLIILFIMVVDLAITILSLSKIKRRIKLLDDISKQMKKLSDVVGEHIANGTFGVMDFNQKHFGDFGDYEALVKRYNKLAAKKTMGLKRLSKAFPLLSKNRFNKILHPSTDVKTTKK